MQCSNYLYLLLKFLLLIYTYITLSQSLEVLGESHGRFLVFKCRYVVFVECSYSVIQKPQKKTKNNLIKQSH